MSLLGKQLDVKDRIRSCLPLSYLPLLIAVLVVKITQLHDCNL